MNFPCTSIERFTARTGLLVLTGSCFFAGCHSTSAVSPQLTGSHGGSLAGLATSNVGKPTGLPQENHMEVMNDGKVVWNEKSLPQANLNMALGLTKPDADKFTNASTPPGYTGTIMQVLPDGRILVRELVNGQRLTETWKSSLDITERKVLFVNDNVVGGIDEFGPDGKCTKRTTFYLGTTQPEKVEEYLDGIHVAKSTTYWQNGNLRMISETDLPTPAGPVNRIQEWYPNGEPKSLSQIHVERDERRQIVVQEKQGRQTVWNEAGYPIFDQEFDHDHPVRDYLGRKKTGTP